MSLSGKDVAEIARLLDASRFSQLELEVGNFKLRIRRDGAGHAPRRAMTRHAAPEPAPIPALVTASTPSIGEVDVIAPLLGTFYHAPRPGDAPFVSVGDIVTADTVIGIIEVMKLMNPVHARVAGEVVALLADNSSPVEAGQPLLRIRTA
jgi:acetyl-CoA carboxylase biotin carboxyl carrier protein